MRDGFIIWILKPWNLQNPSLYGWNINVITCMPWVVACETLLYKTMQFVMSLTFELVMWHVEISWKMFWKKTLTFSMSPNIDSFYLSNQAWGESMPMGPRTGRGWKHAGPRGAGEIHLLAFLEDVLKLGLPPTKRKLNLRAHLGSFGTNNSKLQSKILTSKMIRHSTSKKRLSRWLSWSQILHHRNHDLQEVQSRWKSQWSKPMLRMTDFFRVNIHKHLEFHCHPIHLLEYLVRYTGTSSYTFHKASMEPEVYHV